MATEQEYPNSNDYLNMQTGGTEYNDTSDNPQTFVRELLYSAPELIGTIHGRIYDIPMPKNIEVPCITLQRISETIDPVTFFRRTIVQIDCYSQSHPEADEIAEKVLSILINHSQDTAQMSIFSINMESLRDLSVPETRLYRVTGDYAVIWRKKTW